MRIIISSDNQLGYYVAKFLIKENHTISIIDSSKMLTKSFESYNEVIVYEGSPTSINTLKQAGVKKCDILIAVYRDENINITTCIMAKNLGAKQTIARIDNVEFLDTKNVKAFEKLGVDAMICPEKIAASEICKLIYQAAATEIIDFSDSQLSLFLFKLDEKSQVVDKTLNQISKENPQLQFRAVAIHRDGKTIIPTGQDVFKYNDYAYVITCPAGIDKLLKLSGKTNYKIDNIFIAGGSRIGRKAALELEKNKKVFVIEKEPTQIEKLVDILNTSTIIKGDARNVDLLDQENFQNADAFIALTNSSETNILTCLLAKKYGIKRIITLIDNVEFIEIAQKVGVDAIINKKLITASYISQFILKDKVAELKYLTGVDAEALEFIVKEKSKPSKKCICDLGLPKGAIVGGYVRKKRGYIATGKTQLEVGDKVVVFSLPQDVGKTIRIFN